MDLAVLSAERFTRSVTLKVQTFPSKINHESLQRTIMRATPLLRSLEDAFWQKNRFLCEEEESDVGYGRSVV